jgi:hypothetical protein
VSTSAQLYAALACVLCTLALIGAWAVRKWWRSWRTRRRAHRVYALEARARDLLDQAGFSVEGEQVRQTWTVCCDGESLPIELRADYVVRRGDRRFVADVKTGARATRLTTAATRRQLLEYRVAYDVTGVLLIDMDARRIHEIGFDLRVTP